MTQTATIRITMTSGASEADLYTHLREMVDNIKSMRHDSWYKTLNTDWEESHPVEIEIEELTP